MVRVAIDYTTALVPLLWDWESVYENVTGEDGHF